MAGWLVGRLASNSCVWFNSSKCFVYFFPRAIIWTFGNKSRAICGHQDDPAFSQDVREDVNTVCFQYGPFNRTLLFTQAKCFYEDCRFPQNHFRVHQYWLSTGATLKRHKQTSKKVKRHNQTHIQRKQGQGEQGSNSQITRFFHLRKLGNCGMFGTSILVHWLNSHLTNRNVCSRKTKKKCSFCDFLWTSCTSPEGV